MNSSNLCPIGADDSFGPQVIGCRENFDFTLLFEQSVLSLGPSALMLITCVPRILQLYRYAVKTVSTPLRIYKSVRAI